MEIGFVGFGNMGKAMVKGIIAAGRIDRSQIKVSDKSPDNVKIGNELGVKSYSDNKEVVIGSDIIVLAIKPQIYEMVCEEIREYLKPETIVITIAPGKTIKHMQNYLGENTKIIRTMPNAPVFVGEGTISYCYSENINENELENAISIFDGIGAVESLSENLMDVAVGVGGSLPVFVAMFIEAVADAAVAGGMMRDQAYRIAAQTVYGSSKMLLETKMHPGELKDLVCSPGGTSIEGVKALESESFRYSIIKGVEACIQKSKEM